jgi:hypothetical protein
MKVLAVVIMLLVPVSAFGGDLLGELLPSSQAIGISPSGSAGPEGLGSADLSMGKCAPISPLEETTNLRYGIQTPAQVEKELLRGSMGVPSQQFPPKLPH